MVFMIEKRGATRLNQLNPLCKPGPWTRCGYSDHHTNLFIGHAVVIQTTTQTFSLDTLWLFRPPHKPFHWTRCGYSDHHTKLFLGHAAVIQTTTQTRFLDTLRLFSPTYKPGSWTRCGRPGRCTQSYPSL